MKVLVIGGVAAGTKVAAKLKRENRSDEVLILTAGKDISYAGCGLPYYVSHVIEDRESLIVNTPAKYESLTGAAVKTGVEVTGVDAAAKSVTAKDLDSGEVSTYSYDKLVIATGASPFVPPMEGTDLEGVFLMRTPDDAIGLRNYIEKNGCKRAVVCGAGFIGLEAAENMSAMGLRVTVLDLAPQILPPLDSEIAGYVESKLADANIMCFTGTGVKGFDGAGKVEKVITDRRKMKCDVAVLSIGIRPNTAFLKDSGIEMFKGTILTNEYQETNVADIYAVGDCAMVHQRQTGAPAWSPMGSTANIAGRQLAKNINGKKTAYKGVLGTGVCKLPGVNVGRTGLGEAAAKAAGFDVITAMAVTDDKAHYMPGSGTFIMKMIADKTSHKLLGLQVLGAGAVDKMIDIAVTGISLGATLEDLENLDFAYAPPFSTAISPFDLMVNVMMNKINGDMDSITPVEYQNGAAEGYTLIDASIVQQFPNAPFVDVTKVDGPLADYPKDAKLFLVCNKGKRAYLLQNRLKNFGYTDTKILEAGTAFTSFDKD